MSEVNKAVVRRMIEEGMNKHNISVIAELYQNCVYRSPEMGELRGEVYRQFVSSLLAAFPDLRLRVEDQLAEGDRVVTRWSFTGTHQGTFMGIAPTGKQVTVSGIVIDRIVSGKIVEEWVEWDSLRMMRQLGVVPPAAKVGAKVAA
jgi:steroid delta-isomerase-like uncharacterized protein